MTRNRQKHLLPKKIPKQFSTVERNYTKPTKNKQWNKIQKKMKYQMSLHQYIRCYRCLDMENIGKHCPLSIPKDK